MHPSAEESVRYAFQRDLGVLYVVTLVGWWLMGSGDNVASSIFPPGIILRPIVSALVVLVGLAIFISGVVGVLHQLISDLG